MTENYYPEMNFNLIKDRFFAKRLKIIQFFSIEVKKENVNFKLQNDIEELYHTKMKLVKNLINYLDVLIYCLF